MKISHSSCKVIKNSLNILKEFLDETIFLFSTKGIGIADMDVSKTIFISLKIKKEEFNIYNVEQDIKIALSLTEINEIFKKAKEDEAFTIEADKDKISIEIKGDTIRRYNLPLIDMEYKDINEPAYNFKTSFTLPKNILQQVVDNGLILSNELIINIRDKKLGFAVQETNKSATFEMSDLVYKSIGIISSESEITSKYSLEWLDKICKSMNPIASECCFIELGNDFPIKLTFKDGNFRSTFYLGPRI